MYKFYLIRFSRLYNYYKEQLLLIIIKNKIKEVVFALFNLNGVQEKGTVVCELYHQQREMNFFFFVEKYREFTMFLIRFYFGLDNDDIFRD